MAILKIATILALVQLQICIQCSASSSGGSPAPRKGAALLPGSCGQPIVPPVPCSQQNPQSNIIGGCEAKAYSWPWMAAFGPDGIFDCGASLIDHKWAMTAGHCTKWQDKPEIYRIRFGVNQRKNFTEPGEINAKIAKIHRHPKWNVHTLEYDVSLLELTESVQYTDHIQPVCLAKSDTDIVDSPGNNVWVTGWGEQQEFNATSLAKKLRQVIVPTLDLSVCIDDYGAHAINKECMFCAGKIGKDSCAGDSGGPLFYGSKSFIQYGIVSWGHGCAEAGHAGVYSRVSAYCDWIKETTGLELCQ